MKSKVSYSQVGLIYFSKHLNPTDSDYLRTLNSL